MKEYLDDAAYDADRQNCKNIALKCKKPAAQAQPAS